MADKPTTETKPESTSALAELLELTTATAAKLQEDTPSGEPAEPAKDDAAPPATAEVKGATAESKEAPKDDAGESKEPPPPKAELPPVKAGYRVVDESSPDDVWPDDMSATERDASGRLVAPESRWK